MPSLTALFVIATIGQELMADLAVCAYPHAEVRIALGVIVVIRTRLEIPRLRTGLGVCWKQGRQHQEGCAQREVQPAPPVARQGSACGHEMRGGVHGRFATARPRSTNNS